MAETHTLDTESGKWETGDHYPTVGEIVWWFDHEGNGPIPAIVTATPAMPKRNRASWMPEVKTVDEEGRDRRWVHLQPIPSIDVPRGATDGNLPKLVKHDVPHYCPKRSEPERPNTWRYRGEQRT